jgi:N-acetylmuramoyl-L-alanine amidase
MCLLAFKKQTVNTFPLFGKLIILDIGHGGLDPGSTYKDEYEKDYNLDFSKVLKSNLESMGATVIMTRDGDYDLSSPNVTYRKKSDFNNRIKLINESGADLYLSLHMNYLDDTSYYGGQVFYSGINAKNETIAKTLQDGINKFLKLSKDYKEISDDKYMFKRIEVPGVLIEYGFMSSQKDRQNLKDDVYKNDYSKAIINAIITYFT